MKTISYNSDFAAWAYQQAVLLKSGQFKDLDIENLVEEMEAMSRSEHRELKNRLAILIMHLLKWKYQPERQGNSWRRTINVQRTDIYELLQDSPSLKAHFHDKNWLQNVWDAALVLAEKETQLDGIFPDDPIWSIDEILKNGWYPSEN
jgi:hypothetical protein